MMVSGHWPWRGVCCGMLFLAAGAAAGQAAAGGWQAGVARAKITPEEPLWLAGYAARDREAEGALHDLWVKALAVRDASGHTAVLVTTDIIGYPKDMSDRIRDAIGREHGLARAQIVLSGSHTHSGPVLDNSLPDIYPTNAAQQEAIVQYTHRLEGIVAATVGAALADLAPAAIFTGSAVARFAVNRRNNREAEILQLHALEGPQDHAVPVLKAQRANGDIAAIVFGYACHATTLDGYQWCGDYPGFAQIDIETAYPGAAAMFFAGCGGDQNPLPRRSVALAQQYGRTLAAAVSCALESPMRALAPELHTAYHEVELAFEPPPTREELTDIIEKSEGYVRRWAERMRGMLDAGQSLPATYPYPVQAWRLGDQTVIVMGGEVVVDYAVKLKQLLGGDTVIMGYANDVMAYIPSRRVRLEGGYEGATAMRAYGQPAPWTDDVEDRVMGALRLVCAQIGRSFAGDHDSVK